VGAQFVRELFAERLLVLAVRFGFGSAVGLPGFLLAAAGFGLGSRTSVGGGIVGDEHAVLAVAQPEPEVAHVVVVAGAVLGAVPGAAVDAAPRAVLVGRDGGATVVVALLEAVGDVDAADARGRTGALEVLDRLEPDSVACLVEQLAAGGGRHRLERIE
jgi:hypothetical protein